MRFRFWLYTVLPVSVLTVAVVVAMTFYDNTQAQTQDPVFNQDPGHQSYLFVGGVKFSCPRDFACERSRSDGMAIYIRHKEYNLELVLGIDAKEVPGLPENLARAATSYVFPKQHDFSWKQLPKDAELATGKRASRFETGRGGLQGFNGLQRVVFQYCRIKVKEKEVIVGYLLGLGRGPQAKELFDQNLGGDSMLGWYAQAHIIASLTGEKYTDINSGTVIMGTDITPPKKN
jgi:hypothetical protein